MDFADGPEEPLLGGDVTEGLVRIGDTVTARVEVLEVITAKRRVRLATSCRNQGGEVVVEGEALVMLENRN